MTGAAPNNADWARLAEAVAERRDRRAFAEIYDFFAPRLAAWLRRTGCDTGLAEDIAQDTMTALWTKAALFDPAKSSLGTWLFRIARNRRVDGLRRSRVIYKDPAAFLDAADPGAPDPDALIDAERALARLRAALRDLPEQQAVLIRLAFFDALSHSEIAARTGLPLGTVKSRIRLGFLKLRGAVEAETAGVSAKDGR